MNTFAKNIIVLFLSNENTRYLKSRINDNFLNATEARDFLSTNFTQRQYDFSQRISRELSNSDPMLGVSLRNQVDAYNARFLWEQIADIERTIIPNLTPKYEVVEIPQCNGRTAGANTVRKVMNPTDTLNSWRDSPASLQQYRDDNQGDYRASSRNTGANTCKSIYDNAGEYCAIAKYGSDYCGNASNDYSLNKYGVDRRENMGNRAQYESNEPSVMFNDNSEYGLGFAPDFQLNTPTANALNRVSTADAYQNQAFGFATPESDRRLLGRRIFRSNEAGVENGIPRYEARLYKRNLDRDNGETFADTQYGYQVRGHDMSDLIAQTNRKLKIIDINATNYNVDDQLKYAGLR
jgi:hypothetical protein